MTQSYEATPTTISAPQMLFRPRYGALGTRLDNPAVVAEDLNMSAEARIRSSDPFTQDLETRRRRQIRRAAVLLGLEIPRAAAEAASILPALPILAGARRGDGHPVLVLPGMGASDVSTRILRAFLQQCNYHVHAWRLGRNMGLSRDTVDGLQRRVRELSERHGQAMSIVGWSLGGVYALEIARDAPEIVRQVIALGSPLALAATARPNRDGSPRRGATGTQAPTGVPTTAIYSRTDGIVPWRVARVESSSTSENVEIPGSHFGLGHNPVVLWIVADRLAQPEGQWRPFQTRGLGRLVKLHPFPTSA